jgi:multidrug efflux pump
MRFMGEDAIGIAVAMKDGGDILRLGDTLQKEIRAPATHAAGRHGAAQGLDQPHAVRESVGEFMRVLAKPWRSCCW